MAGEVTSVTVTEQTLYNLTITEDDSNVVTVAVPDAVALIEVSHYDVSVTMSNTGTGEGVFKSKSIDNFNLKSIKDDDKTIDITSGGNNDQINVKLPDAGISTPDGFTINADSDSSAKIELPGPTVDLSKAKLLTDLDVNSKDLDSVATITATTGDITTVNSTTVNATTGTITTVGSTTGNITTVNSTNVNSTNLDVDTGTIDDLTSTTVDINGGSIDGTTVGATTSSTGRFSTLASDSVDLNGGSIDGTTVGASVSSTGTFSTLNSESVDINGGAIDGTTIGATTPSTIVTSNLTATTADINAGTIDNTTIGATTPSTIVTTDLTATTADINGGTIDGTVVGGSTPAAVSTTSLVATTADINAGTIDNSVIGATTPVAGTFTTLGATTGNITTVNATDVNVSDDLDVTDDASIGGDLAVTGNTVLTGNLTVNGTQTIVNTETLTVDDNIIVLNNNEAGTPSQNGGIEIERGTSDNAVFQWTEATDKWEAKVGSSYAALKVEDVNTNTLTATTGNITNMNSSNVGITGGTIDNVTITNVGAINGTSIGATTSSSGRFTTLQSDSVDINGGTIDGVAIAGATSLGTSGNLTVTGTTGLTGLLTAHDVAITGKLNGPSEGFESHIKPAAADTYDCGINTARWRNGYFDNVTITTNLVLDAGMSTFTLQNGSDILVTTEGGSDLGSTDKAFNALWVDEIHPSEAEGGTNTIEFHGGFQPDTNGVFDIGVRTLAWDNVYSNTIVTSVLDSINTGSTETIELQADLIPDGDKTRDLGSASKAFHSVYVGDGSLYVDGAKVLGSADGSAINMSTDTGQDLYISAGGASGTSGELVLGSRENKTTLTDTTVNLGGTSGSSATVNVFGALDVNGAIDSSSITTGGFVINNDAITNADGGITLTSTQTDGAGYIHLNTPDVYVGPFNGALKLDESSIGVTNTNGDLQINSNGTGLIKLDDLEFSNADSPYGESKVQFTAPNDHVLCHQTSGNGYHFILGPASYIGADAGLSIIPASGAATVLKPYGGQNIEIKPDGSNTVSLEGNVNGDLTATNTNTKGIAANTQGLTIPGVSQYSGFNYFSQTDGIRAASTPSTGFPFVGYMQTDNINQSQPPAQYLINHMDYDISGGLSGHGVQVSFAAQDETGKLLDIANNLCKLRNESVSGSSGSSTVDSWDGEYTLSVTGNAGSGANNVTTNVITTNTDFTEVSTELRVVDKPGNSGNTALSGVYLTYDGAETGVPSAILQLRKESDDSNVESIKLEEARTTFGAVTKQYKASSDPSGEAGDTYFNTTTNKFRGHNGTAWVDLS